MLAGKIVRERFPLDSKVKAALCALAGLSLRTVATLFISSYESVRNWILPLKEVLQDLHHPSKGYKAIAIDETCLKLRGKLCICCYWCGGEGDFSFNGKLKKGRRCSLLLHERSPNKPLILVDRTPWYKAVFNFLILDRGEGIW